MCYHLTASLPKGTNMEALRPVIEEYDMAFQPLSNESVASQLERGASYFIATKGHCDCGTVLGYQSTGHIAESIKNSKMNSVLLGRFTTFADILQRNSISNFDLLVWLQLIRRIANDNQLWIGGCIQDNI